MGPAKEMARYSLPSADLASRDAFQRSDQDTLGEHREPDPHGAVDRFLSALRRLRRHLLGDEQGDLLTVVGLGQLADALRNALDMPILEQLLAPGGQVLGPRDLDEDLRVQTPGAGLPGDAVALVRLGEQALEVILHGLAARHSSHPSHPPSAGELRRPSAIART